MSALYSYDKPAYPQYRGCDLDYDKPADVVEALRNDGGRYMWRVLFHAPAGALDRASLLQTGLTTITNGAPCST